MYDLSFSELLKAESPTGEHMVTEIWNERSTESLLENTELILGKATILVWQIYST